MVQILHPCASTTEATRKKGAQHAGLNPAQASASQQKHKRFLFPRQIYRMAL